MKKEAMNESLFDLMSKLADDILEMSEDQVDAELLELGLFPDEVARSTKALFGKTLLRHSSAQVTSKRELAGIAPDISKVIAFAPGVAKAKLEELVRRDPASFPELTMAARKGDSISDADAQSQLEDLVAVGAIKIEDLQ